MILYHHDLSPTPPPWLAGAPNLCHREDPGRGFTYGLGEPFEFGRMPEAGGHPLGDGWSVALVGDFDPFWLRRNRPGQPVAPCPDVEGRVWAAPIILAADGSRAFQVKYGKGFRPVLTWEQTQLIEFANSARAELRAMFADASKRSELMPTACAWAARAFSYVNHITPEAIDALGLLDETSVIGGLVTLCSYAPEVQDAHG